MFFACLTAAAADRHPVIVVADVGVDDSAALLLALASPELEVLGVASTFGCHSDPRVTAVNARSLIGPDIPVYVGARWPYGGAAPIPVDGTRFHGANGFGGPAPSAAACEAAASGQVSAAEFIATTARARPGQVTLLSFSPLTDVALALALEPALPTLLRGFVAMGGAVHEPGNVSPLAEANFAHDAAAARAVLAAWDEAQARGASPIVLVPLDVTGAALVSAADVAAFRKGTPAAAKFADAWHSSYLEAYCTMRGLCDATPLHDAHVVSYLLRPELYSADKLALRVQVSVAGEASHGHSLLDRRSGGGGATATGGVTVLLGVDAEGWRALLHERLAGA